MIDVDGQTCYGLAEKRALFSALCQHLIPEKVKLVELDPHINGGAFVPAVSKGLLELLDARY